MQSFFIISLDFELNWGIFEKDTIYNNPQYFENTLEVIPEILNSFEQFNVHATWATVGMLFMKDRNEWLTNKPGKIPAYKNNKVSSYNWYEDNYGKHFDRYLFAPELIKKIAGRPGQEIGTHTYSHYYCLEDGQTLEDFSADLHNAKIISDAFNIQVESLVFPRNQANETYLQECWKKGIKSVRTNPDVWYWDVEKKRKLNKLGRMIDAYLFSTKPHHFDIFKISREKDKPLKIPASRLLRPFDKIKILNKLKIRRIINEMTDAAKNKKCYHLWWHPHNFGTNPKESIEDLNKILKHYSYLNEKYGMKTVSMGELYNIHNNRD